MFQIFTMSLTKEGIFNQHTLYECLHCGVLFSSYAKLLNHERIHTGDTRFKCRICNKTFTKCSQLKHHIEAHSDVRLHKCKYCERSFKQKSHLKLHINSNHSVSYQASQGKVLTKDNLSKKQASDKLNGSQNTAQPSITNNQQNSVIFIMGTNPKHHFQQYETIRPMSMVDGKTKILNNETNNDKFLCNEKPNDHLWQNGQTNDLITKYQRVNGLYKCQFCFKTFIRLSNLLVHEGTHAENVVYRCEVCLENFTGTTELNNHMTQCKIDSCLKCLACGKDCNSKLELNCNVKTDSNIKIEISENNANCKQPGPCIINQRMHSVQHNFTCELCGEFFIGQNDLIAHERSHNGEKLYECYLCLKTFKEKAQVEKHMKIVHCDINTSNDKTAHINKVKVLNSGSLITENASHKKCTDVDELSKDKYGTISSDENTSAAVFFCEYSMIGDQIYERYEYKNRDDTSSYDFSEKFEQRNEEKSSCSNFTRRLPLYDPDVLSQQGVIKDKLGKVNMEQKN